MKNKNMCTLEELNLQAAMLKGKGDLEGVIRLGLFTLYVVLISCMKDIKRTYMYHGAEHKCINCIERGRELNVKNVRKSSRYHARCGTSFLFIVMVISIVFFIFIRVDSPILRVVFRILLVPVIAGVSYEFIRLAGRTDNPFMKVLSLPGKAGCVTRPNYVKARFLGEDMEEYEIEGEELLARAICHELDHLDGHMYTEKVEGPLHEVKYEED